MSTKLTLRMEDGIVRKAKNEARRRGKSVSRMVAEYFDLLESRTEASDVVPPITESLIGIMKGRSLSQEDYRRHLREKYL